jgi:hypothetical protein
MHLLAPPDTRDKGLMGCIGRAQEAAERLPHTPLTGADLQAMARLAAARSFLSREVREVREQALARIASAHPATMREVDEAAGLGAA